jgi:hypothetical protein
MIIVAGGDSIIWGSELADSPHGGPDGYSRNTFSAILAGNNYNCTAYPGIGNKEISHRIINASQQLVDTKIKQIVLVCWTWPTRDNLLNSDNEILELQNFLNFYSIPYLFTCVDNCILTNNTKIDWNNWYLFPAGKLDKFGNKVDETIAPRGFYQWAIENKYNIGVDGHPLEQAHMDAAELIKEKFNELVKKSI